MSIEIRAFRSNRSEKLFFCKINGDAHTIANKAAIVVQNIRNMLSHIISENYFDDNSNVLVAGIEEISRTGKLYNCMIERPSTRGLILACNPTNASSAPLGYVLFAIDHV